jgi:hypothetical protein
MPSFHRRDQTLVDTLKLCTRFDESAHRLAKVFPTGSYQDSHQTENAENTLRCSRMPGMPAVVGYQDALINALDHEANAARPRRLALLHVL